ncbi:MAG TPA: hypothetical protein VKS21_11990, partial [Spirochaetota bacterium]|nr:hypothetical protein [Spirochaetota bacterium]
WKRGKELTKTRYDIQEVSGASTRTDNGYLMEIFIPAAEIKKYQGKPGTYLNAALTGTAHGKKFKREFFWPWSKNEASLDQPANLGYMLLK